MALSVTAESCRSSRESRKRFLTCGPYGEYGSGKGEAEDV